MKRSPLKRNTPLRRMGIDKARETRKYNMRRPQFLLEHRYCEVPDRVHDCTFYATTVHHSNRQHWKVMNEEKWWVAACMNGHTWVEDHKNEARKMGLILYK